MALTLEERLALVESELAIRRTLATYGHALDYGYEDKFVDCWIEGGELAWPSMPLLRGHDELRTAARIHTRAPDHAHKHLVMSSVIDIRGEQADVVSFYLRIDLVEGKPQISSFGRYRDVLVRCEDLRWRFKSRIAETEGRYPGLTTYNIEALKNELALHRAVPGP